MTLEKRIRAIAGGLVLLSLAGWLWGDPRFLWLAAFVGANLLQSAFTGICPAETILEKLGWAGPCPPRAAARPEKKA